LAMVIHYLILLLTIVMAIGYFEFQFLELGFSKLKY
jgi:hypothetical protein